MHADRVVIDDPATHLKWFVTSAAAERGFCDVCGTSLFFRAPDWPGELHIARASFTDPIDREPQVHVYYDTHVSWATTGDSLPRKVDPKSQA